MNATPPSRFADVEALAEPRLRFNIDVRDAIDTHPLRGLATYGPASQQRLQALTNRASIALISPEADWQDVAGLFKQLQQPYHADPPYWPRYPGFASTYGIEVKAADNHVHHLVSRDIETRMSTRAEAIAALTELFSTQAIRLHAQLDDFNIAVIYLPERWGIAYTTEDGFDLHDYIKAAFAVQGIPTQIVRQKTLQHSVTEVLWTLSIAIYAKMGGIPWTLAGLAPETAYIGLAYTIRHDQPSATGKRRFVTCCSQLLDADGSGAEFTLFDTQSDDFEGDNPFLSRNAMRSVAARTLNVYLGRHGVPPKRVVLHKTTRFTRDEIGGAHEALAGIADVELLQIQDETSWQGLLLDGREQAAAYPVQRGCALQLDDYSALLWTQGNAASVVGKNWFKEGVGIPRPLLLRRWAGSTDLHNVASEALALTKMNVNNGNLYDTLPATLRYASLLAKVVKRTELPSRNYPLRFFI